jgi:hypothetical protein
VSSSGRITLSKFIKDDRKLTRQKEEFAENKMAIQFKEIVNFFTKLNEYMGSLDAGYELLFDGDVLYKNDERTSAIIGDMLRAYYLYVIDQNKDMLHTIRQSQLVYNTLRQLLNLLFESAGAHGATINDVERNISGLFEILQQKRVFEKKLGGDYYEIYKKVHESAKGVLPLKAEGDAVFFDLFQILYMSIEGFAARFRNAIYYKKGATGTIKLDIFTACNFEAATKTALKPYFVIKNKKYNITDVNGTIFIDKFMDALEEIDVIWKQLYVVRDSSLSRRNLTMVEKLRTVLADFMNIRVEVDYEKDTVQNVLDAITVAVRQRQQRGGSRSKAYSPKSAETLSLGEAEALSTPRSDIYDVLETELTRQHGSTFYNQSPGILVGFILTLMMLHDEYVGISVAKMTPFLEGGDGGEATSGNPMNDIIDVLQNANNYLSYAMYETPGDPALVVKADTLINDILDYIQQPNESAYAMHVDMENILVKIRGKLGQKQSDPIFQFKSDYLYDMKDYPTITDINVFKKESIGLLQRLNFLCMSIKFEEKRELSPVKIGTKRRRVSSPKGSYTRKKTMRNKNTA